MEGSGEGAGGSYDRQLPVRMAPAPLGGRTDAGVLLNFTQLLALQSFGISSSGESGSRPTARGHHRQDTGGGPGRDKIATSGLIAFTVPHFGKFLRSQPV